MIKVNNEKQLTEILKIFAQESVKKAKKVLNEDVAQQNYSTALNAAEKSYGVKLKEEEEAETEAEDAPAESDKQETQDQSSEEDNSIESSLDGLMDVINRMRAGRSTKNKDIESALNKYHNRLDDDERKILYIFLKQLANILQGAVSGEDAIDPSDPPNNADVSFGDDAEKEKSASKPKSDAPVKSDSEGEDNSPPIQVGRQDLSEIRKRVQRLMKRY